VTVTASSRLRLGVNIDHVATIRNARGGAHPEPLRAAEVALAAGADGITAHLREDRRHISDADIDGLSALVKRLDRPLNLEMAVTDEMVEIALRHRPRAVCLVPERREERTTEGGLDVAKGHNIVAPAVKRLRDEGGARVSLFIEPSKVQVAVSEAVGAQVVELHTGAYCDALRAGDAALSDEHLGRLKTAAAEAHKRGLEVHAGHGIDYDSVSPVAAIPEVMELNIGHFLIGEAIFMGLEAAIGRMRVLMDAARPNLGSAP
jgi:pyridoxine 5-phosphate synthase